MIIKNWNEEIPEDFSNDSRVWIYQSPREFSTEEEQYIDKKLSTYVNTWNSHRRPVKGWAKVFFHQFIVLMADDTSDKLCGSAIDGSIRFVKKLEDKLNLELLNRMNLGFTDGEQIFSIPMQEVGDRVETGNLKKETLFFNNTVSTKEGLLNAWIQPLGESFLGKRFSLS